MTARQKVGGYTHVPLSSPAPEAAKAAVYKKTVSRNKKSAIVNSRANANSMKL